jgi:magnesium transporter
VWLGLHEPTRVEFEAAIKEFDLHELAVDDAIAAHQRPKVEVYDDSLFVVLKTARYDDASETVEFAELQLFVGDGFVVTVRHGQASALREVRTALECDTEVLTLGPSAVLHAVVDHVVDGYQPVIDGIDNDLFEVEREVFSDLRRNSAERIFKLKREVLEFHRNTQPLVEGLEQLRSGHLPQIADGLSDYFRDVEDHLLRVVSRIEGLGALLSDALDANTAAISVRQNEDMRTISAWVAIAAIPTMIGGVYGMNFENMPELRTEYAYFIVLGAMVILCSLAYWRFRRSGWL